MGDAFTITENSTFNFYPRNRGKLLYRGHMECQEKENLFSQIIFLGEGIKGTKDGV